MIMRDAARFLAAIAAACLAGPVARAGDLERVEYNHPGLEVDLGVGLWAWPLAMDADDDGDLDLVVSCPDVPSNGTYVFENPGGDGPFPVFEPGVKIGPGRSNVVVSHVDGGPRVLVPGGELPGFLKGDLTTRREIYPEQRIHRAEGNVRANQWSLVDDDGDGALDLVVGQGFWGDYGWDDAFNERGEWTRGPLHGYVYLIRNRGTTAMPSYEEPTMIEAGGRPIDVYGMPSPNLADYDGDGDLDLLCGEFIDGFTYYRNVGGRAAPRYEAGRVLTVDGQPLRMPLCMIVPTAIDWDGDGDPDLVVGQEDGRVALVEHTGAVVDGLPVFAAPRFFRQQAEAVKFGALVTPVSFDWDGDGDEDLVCGNTAGEVGFIENLDGGDPPRWAEPVRLEAGGAVLRIEAGPNGSIQGPAEQKWGYTTLGVDDWDLDGLPDLVVNSIWGKVVWYRNVGTRTAPELAAAAPVEVEWDGPTPGPSWNWWDPEPGTLATQWRTTPVVEDWDGDGLPDLVMLDHEGYLAHFPRERRGDRLVLRPGRRIFVDEAGEPLRLNDGEAGKSGRRKLCIVDWDGDVRRDLLVNSTNANFLRNVEERDGLVVLRDEGPLSDRRLAGHTTSPTTVDWDGDGVRDLLVGAEDGFLYHMRNPRSEGAEGGR